MAKFTINDSGIGINKDNIERIFDPFERVHNSDTTSIPGTGLGLSISRLLAELLGGDIAVESTPKIGSTFVFSVLMPSVAAPNCASPHFQTSLTREIIGYQGTRKNILIVDDESDHRTLINDLLSPLRFNLFEAHNARTAIDKMQLIDFDLFILDVSMPDMDGWVLAQHINDTGRTAPIIMVSGNAIEDHREEIKGKLHDYYLIKPVIFSDLLNKIGIALNIEWLYEEEKTSANHPIKSSAETISTKGLVTQEMIFPPAVMLQEIKIAAAIGHIKAVATIVNNIKFLDEKYASFVEVMENHLQSFNLQAILNFIENQK